MSCPRIEISGIGPRAGGSHARAAWCALLAAVFVFALLALGGCSQGEDNGSDDDVQVVRVTDSAGRSVEVPRDPRSIAVFDSFSSEVAVLSGAGPRLSGVPGGTKSDEILKMIYPDLEKVATTSGNNVNLETQVSSGTDIAILRSSMSDEECAKLDRAGIAYVKVGYTTVAEQIEAIRLVGAVCGPESQERAERIADSYQKTVDDIQTRVEGIGDGEKVRVYHSINDELTTDSSASLGASWIELAGCEDVSAEEAPGDNGDFAATVEQVYAWNPDLVICNDASAAKRFRNEGRWQGLSAVSKGSVDNIPVGATRWGQRGSAETWLAMTWLGKKAYPKRFRDLDFEQTVKDTYQELYGIKVDHALYGKMLEGSLRASGGGGK